MKGARLRYVLAVRSSLNLINTSKYYVHCNYDISNQETTTLTSLKQALHSPIRYHLGELKEDMKL